MIIELARVKPEGTPLAGEEPAEILDLPASADLRAERPIRYALMAVRTGDTLVVTGSLETEVTLRCSRCAEAFDFHVSEPAFACDREVPPGVESVDLTGDIRETILLAFPNYPVCKPDCRGLCAQCGVNLNRSRCGCRPPETSGWEALDKLKLD